MWGADFLSIIRPKIWVPHMLIYCTYYTNSIIVFIPRRVDRHRVPVQADGEQHAEEARQVHPGPARCVSLHTIQIIDTLTSHNKKVL